MNWNELPQEYRDLEKGFNESVYEVYDKNSNRITARFEWVNTPQGASFWLECFRAKSISELPPIRIAPTTIYLIKELADGKISCANCVFNVNSICQAINWEIPIHKENDFFCSDHRLNDNL